jgi:hypothetical protein
MVEAGEAGEAGEEGGCTQVATPIVDFHPAKLVKALGLARSTCSTWSGFLFFSTAGARLKGCCGLYQLHPCPFESPPVKA